MLAVSANFKLAAIVGFAVSYVFLITLSLLSRSQLGREIGLIPLGTANTSSYPTPITPSSDTLSIWGFIYAYVAVAIGYAFSTICRKGASGQGIYDEPEIIPPSFYLAFSTNLTFSALWLIVWPRGQLYLGATMLLVGVVFLVFSLSRSCAQLDKVASSLVKQGYSKDIWYVRVFVQNMNAVYMSWLSVASLINVVIVAVYRCGADMDTSGMIAMIALFAVVTLWFGLETFVLDRYLRYVIAQYAVYITALAGIIKRGYDPTSMVSVAVAINLAWVSALLLGKIVIMVYRTINNPINYVKNGEDETGLNIKKQIPDSKDPDSQKL